MKKRVSDQVYGAYYERIEPGQDASSIESKTAWNRSVAMELQLFHFHCSG